MTLRGAPPSACNERQQKTVYTFDICLRKLHVHLYEHQFLIEVRFPFSSTTPSGLDRRQMQQRWVRILNNKNDTSVIILMAVQPRIALASIRWEGCTNSRRRALKCIIAALDRKLPREEIASPFDESIS